MVGCRKGELSQWNDFHSKRGSISFSAAFRVSVQTKHRRGTITLRSERGNKRGKSGRNKGNVCEQTQHEVEV